jgi:ABC-type transport system involved in multi-copper enzyme maturation permease subunit
VALPLVGRELARIGRRRTSYALRVIIPLASLILLLFIVLLLSTDDFFFGGVWLHSGLDAETLGRVLSVAAFLFQIGVVVLIAPVLSAGMVAQEKQDRTLGLLILADLRGYDIIFSKWLSAFLHAQLLLLTTLPILAIAALFGGVAVPVMALQIVFMSVAAATVCAAGIFASTAFRRAGEAVVTTLVFIVAYSLLANNAAPALWPGVDWDIFYAAYNADNLHFLGPLAWIPPILAAVIASALLLASAAILLPSRVFERPARLRRAQLRAQSRSAGGLSAIEWSGRGPTFARGQARAARVSPVAALVQRSSTGLATTLRPWPVKVVMSLVLALVSMMICTFGTLIVVALIAYDVASSMRSIRDQGLMDDLRITPLEWRDLAKGISQAHIRRCRFYYPALALSSGYGLAMMSFMFLPMMHDTYFSEFSSTAQVGIVILAVVFLIVYVALLLRMVVLATCCFSRTTMTVAVQTILVVTCYIGLRFAVMVATTVAATATTVAATMNVADDIIGTGALPFAHPIMVAAINIGAMLLAVLFFRLVYRESFDDARQSEG